jgi:hypothetical protein
VLKAAVIETVGERAYYEACPQARAEAERVDFGQARERESWTSDVPHQAADALWDADAQVQEKVETLFELYDELPAYGLLMYAIHHYREWPEAVRTQFWDAVRTRLGGVDQALARPLAYSLWCDWFEDPTLVEEVWAQLTTPSTHPAVLREVLIASGPVPYRLKRPLYTRLVAQPEWHYYIFRSLLHSTFDVYGQLERQDAGQWLARLQLPSTTEHLSDLRARLS